MRNQNTRKIAFGGVMAALAVVIMCLGGLIPVATYVCPLLCMMVLNFICKTCGKRIAWAWFGAVSLLTVLLGPDKEAAGVFLFLGYYPIIKNWFDRKPINWLWKMVYFTVCTLVLYYLMMHVLGMTEVSEDFQELGTVMTVGMLVAGNLIFLLTDRVLANMSRKIK